MSLPDLDHFLDASPDLISMDPESVVLFSSVSLCRNLQEMNFPAFQSEKESLEVNALISKEILKNECFNNELKFNLNHLSHIEKKVLKERFILGDIDPDLMSKHASVFYNDSFDASYLINYENHLTIQCSANGFELESIQSKAIDKEREFGKFLSFAFREEFGFLTASPKRLGSTLSYKVLLDLSASGLSQNITKIKNAATVLGYELNCMMPETDKNLFIYELSSERGLGQKEEALLSDFSQFVAELIEAEENARNFLLAKDRTGIFDIFAKSYAMLRYSYKMPEFFCLNSIMYLRNGIALGAFKSLDIKTVNNAFIQAQSGHLQLRNGTQLDKNEALIKRAEIMREIFC